jgi:hypothetical protein
MIKNEPDGRRHSIEIWTKLTWNINVSNKRKICFTFWLSEITVVRHQLLLEAPTFTTNRITAWFQFKQWTYFVWNLRFEVRYIIINLSVAVTEHTMRHSVRNTSLNDKDRHSSITYFFSNFLIGWDILKVTLLCFKVPPYSFFLQI